MPVSEVLDGDGRRPTGQLDESWTPDRLFRFILDLRSELEAERRAQFAPFGIDSSCLWPASRVFHEHSQLSEAWTPALSLEAIEALTTNLSYKSYPDVPRVALPAARALRADLDQVIRARRTRHEFGRAPVGLSNLATLLQLSCGVTEPGPIPRRAAPSAGALYPVETYVLAFAAEGLSGIYHYAALDHALEHVAPLADFERMADVLPGGLFLAAPPVILTLSVVFERTQLKYLERGYRFALIEAGHIAQNLALVATALGLNAVCMGGFLDAPFNALMQFDVEQEAVVYAVLIGHPRA